MEYYPEIKGIEISRYKQRWDICSNVDSFINLINEIKSIKTLERKNTNKTSLSEQNLGNFNLLSKKIV